MQSSQAPTQFQKPFAAGAASQYRRVVPVDSSSTPGAASFTDGFPAACFQAIASGGIPPAGEDFNGILYAITQAIQWIQAGGPIVYDPVFSAAIGGYPEGAILVSADGTHLWRSSVDNNTSDPDTGGAGWAIPQSTSVPWADITGVPNFLLTSDFASTLAAAFTSAQSIGAATHVMLPGGFMLQIGTYTAATTDTAYTVSLPTSFGTSHLFSFACVNWSGSVAGCWTAYATPGSLSTVLLTADVQSDSASNIPLTYICFGKM
jgi:hypothetical protein